MGTPKLLAAVLLLALGGCAGTPINPGQLPTNLVVKPGVTLPVRAGIGVYLPAGALQYNEVFRGQIVQRGRFMREGVDAVARHFFATVVHRDQPTADPVGLVLDLDPKWSGEPGKFGIELAYRLYDAQGKQLMAGSKRETLPLTANAPDVLIKNLAIKATQQIMVEIVNSPLASPATPRPTIALAQFPARLLLNEESPWRLAPGFYINPAGQLLTAASGVQDCLRIDVVSGETRRAGTLVAQSALLNLAVVDTGAPFATPLSLSVTRPALGAATTAVSYTRNKEGAVTRGLSFGNVVGHEGAATAFGVFQFSTATRPASLGAPILGPDGRLIGVYAGGYSYDYLQNRSLLPANTYQGLYAEIAAQFLERHRVAYSKAEYADTQAPVDRAGAATVQIACYQ
ncbi:serine protease [Arenimonas sp.]|uniref:S1 family peptidase n=1 Tax=Arenimonas sp. TaxID=1872635 RepID=UPI002E33590A|nr:serine protease [Arenimonas sp.]HEX4853635.1 serine protease [Arenimonas sp.]